MKVITLLLFIALFFVIFSGTYAGVCEIRAYEAAEFGRVEGFAIAEAEKTASAPTMVSTYGLLMAPFADFLPIDTFSQSRVSRTCQSSNLMRTNGFVCLTDEQRALVSSRGGNLT